jgi:hypothetical protein
MKTSKAVKGPVTSRGSRDAAGRAGRVSSKTPARSRSGDASMTEPKATRAVRAGTVPRRSTKATRSRDASGSTRSGQKASTRARVGFVCPPCGRFVPTSVQGVVLRDGRGSPSRFCSPSCRQAAYRRRQAGVSEDVALQLGGGRDRSLTRSGAEAARGGRGRRKNA